MLHPLENCSFIYFDREERRSKNVFPSPNSLIFCSLSVSTMMEEPGREGPSTVSLSGSQENCWHAMGQSWKPGAAPMRKHWLQRLMHSPPLHVPPEDFIAAPECAGAWRPHATHIAASSLLHLLDLFSKDCTINTHTHTSISVRRDCYTMQIKGERSMSQYLQDRRTLTLRIRTKVKN